MRRFALILIASFLLVIPAVAQDGYPLSPDLQPITPENAAQLTELASIGSTIPGRLLWSPDGVHLAIRTSAKLQIFDSTNLDAPPFVVPDLDSNPYVEFDAEGHFVVYKSDGRDIWDVETRQLIPPTPRPTTEPAQPVRYVSPEGEVEAVPDFQHDQIIIHLVDPRVIPAKKLADLNTRLDADFNNMTFSPNGRKLVIQATRHSTDDDNDSAPIIQLWDTSSRTLIKKWPIPYSEIDELVFSADSHLLGVVESNGTWDSEVNDGELQIWNTATGELFDRMLLYESSDYVPASNGRFAVRHNDDIVLWTGQDFIHLPASVCAGESENKALLKFSPSGDWLITGVQCGDQIQLWDVTKPIDPNKPTVVLDSDNLIAWVVFSPDEKKVATQEENFAAQVWDVQSGAPLFDVEGEASGVGFSIDGTLLSGNDKKGNRVLWDASTGKTIITLPSGATYNADWSRAADWMDDTHVRVTDTRSGESADVKVIDQNLGRLTAFDGTAGIVFYISDDIREIHGYDLRSADVFRPQPAAHYYELMFLHDGKYFLNQNSSSDAAILSIWESDHPTKLFHSFTIPEACDFARNYALSADGKLFSDLDVACGYRDGGYRLWDTADGDLLARFESGHRGPYSATFSADDKWAVVGWANGIDILNIADAIQAARANENQLVDSSYRAFSVSDNEDAHVVGVQISADGQWLAASIQFSDSQPVTYGIGIFNFHDLIEQGGALSEDIEKHVEISVAKTGYDEYGKYNLGRPQFSPDSHLFLTEDGLYDVDTGDLLASVTSTTAAFSPDSKTLVTAGEDGLQVWDVAALANGEATQLATFAMQEVQKVAFSPDGKTLYIQFINDVQVWAIPPAS